MACENPKCICTNCISDKCACDGNKMCACSPETGSCCCNCC